MPTGWPVAGFHNRTVPSAPALASSLPSGLNATPVTPPLRAGVSPKSSADGPAGGRVPQPDGAVGAGAGQQLAVRAERHPGHAALGARISGARSSADGLPGGRVPQPDGAVAVGAGQQLAVRAERHPGHAGQHARCRPRWDRPTVCPVAGFHNQHDAVPVGARRSSLPSGLNATPVTAPLRASNSAGGIGRQGRQSGLPGGRVPQPHDSRRLRRRPAACRSG